MDAAVESIALKALHPKRRTSGPISRAMLNSLCLHAAVFLLLFLGLQHHHSALPAKRSTAVIALNAPLYAPPAPPAIPSRTLPATPVRRHHSNGAATPASRPIGQMPPEPASQTAAAPSTAQVATAAEATPAPSIAEIPAAPSATGEAQLPQPPPLAYLIEVSRIIRVHLDDQKPRVHGLTVVHIRIARDGSLLGAGIAQSSGSSAVDEAALSVIVGIHRFPEPPSAYLSAIGDFSIDQPIRFLG